MFSTTTPFPKKLNIYFMLCTVSKLFNFLFYVKLCIDSSNLQNQVILLCSFTIPSKMGSRYLIQQSTKRSVLTAFCWPFFVQKFWVFLVGIRKLLDYVKLHISENELKKPTTTTPKKPQQTPNNATVSFQVFLALRVQLPTHAKKKY